MLKELTLKRVGDYRKDSPAFVSELLDGGLQRAIAFNLPEGVYMTMIDYKEPQDMPALTPVSKAVDRLIVSTDLVASIVS